MKWYSGVQTDILLNILFSVGTDALILIYLPSFTANSHALTILRP